MFYIHPPTGNLSLVKLETVSTKRLDFLMAIQQGGETGMSLHKLTRQCELARDSDCLIEGSRKDMVSHFLLRLACCRDQDMSEFFMEAEKRLFAYRFSCLSPQELLRCVRPLQSLVRTTDKEHHTDLHPALKSIVSVLKCITSELDWSVLIQNYSTGHPSSRFLSLPFTCVLDLVARRQVDLYLGLAQVPIQKLGDVMVGVFDALLRFGLKLARHVTDGVQEDLRMRRLLHKLKVRYYERRGCMAGAGGMPWPEVRADNIDTLSDSFPPCMRQLHHKLRTQHRLRHSARIQYTLFLKDIGLGLSEALHFWREEYSVPMASGCQATCHHSWQDDAARYTYNIRHLYGLEGSRINYRGHCCQSLQTSDVGPGQEGGCPFNHYDNHHLGGLLRDRGLTPDQLELIQSIVAAGQYTTACRMFLMAKMRNNANHTKDRYSECNGTAMHSKNDIQQAIKDSQQFLGSSQGCYDEVECPHFHTDHHDGDVFPVKELNPGSSTNIGESLPNFQRPLEYFVLHSLMAKDYFTYGKQKRPFSHSADFRGIADSLKGNVQ